jgi:hypothetical protein
LFHSISILFYYYDSSDWVKDYSIRFNGCETISSFEGNKGMQPQVLAKFKLCPTDSCRYGNSGSCNKGGDYVVELKEFVNAIHNDTDYNDVNDLVECKELGSSSSNSSYQRYYSGAYCTSKGVFIGAFKDSTCTKKAPSDTFESYMGYSMPTDPLVTYDCVSCMESNNNNGNGNGNNDDIYDSDSVSDMCEGLYKDAGKCESKMDSDVVLYPDTTACEMIQTTLVQLDRAFTRSSRGRAAPSVMFAWMFGLASVVMGAYIFVLKKQEHRTNGVNLLDGCTGTNKWWNLLDGTGLNKWWVF